MGIIKPEYHLKSKKDLPNLRHRVKGLGRHRNLTGDLNLTTMIDAFAVIIFFLLQSFSATGEIFLANEDITLPNAYYARQLTRSPIVTVMEDKIYLEGHEVGQNSGIQQREEFKWELPALVSRLQEYKNFFESINQGAKYPGDIIIQADRELKFVFIKRVMYSLVKEGFGNLQLVVRGRVGTDAKLNEAAAESR